MEHLEDNLNCDNCSTRYPVMLVHGTSMSERRSLRCWGRIPAALTKSGARVVFGMQDAWGCTHTNKLQLAVSVDKALEKFNAEKINIIAHSKGGLDARALAALPGYGEKIASITTISTPHRGLGWLSKFWPFTKIFIAVASVTTYPFIRLFTGDKKPNPYRLSKIMTRRGAEKFNLETPNLPGIYYQSFAGKMPDKKRGNFLFFFTRYLETKDSGDNDGLVSVESAKWGNFRGIITSGDKHGITHTDEVDYFKRDYKGGKGIQYDGVETYSDITQIYLKIVSDLKNRGF